MFFHHDALTFSASDLANFLSCRHLSHLDRRAAHGELTASAWRDPGLELLHERGLAHERAYVESLRASGLAVADLRAIEDADSAVDRTVVAMQQGAEVIVQGALRDGCWSGRTDILWRIDTPSNLGEWSYEVVDTKLAQQTRARTVLQLALYSDLLSRHLGQHPEHMWVVKPGPDFVREPFRWDDFAAYFRRMRQEFEAIHADGISLDSSYPLPVTHCDTCRWWTHCRERWNADDHLSLVAGIRTLHINELERQGITTLEVLAEPGRELQRPQQGSPETYTRLQRQAQTQIAGRRSGTPFYSFRPDAFDTEPAGGLGRLPEPSPGDIFFDFEADPFYDDGGLEFLFGYAIHSSDGELEYHASWARNRLEERQAFERFVEFVSERMASYPDLHIYHFSPYEPSAIKRLMGRHARCEDTIDQWLRGERFVDLLAVTRQGLWAGVERYSLKELEPFYAFERQLDLPTASRALHRLTWALEMGTPGALDPEAMDRQRVEEYNRDDCLSTAALRDWLENRRREAIAAGHEIPRPPRPDSEASDKLQAEQAEVEALVTALTGGLSVDPDDFTENDRGCQLLAHLLDYFRRENKSAWWEFFRLRDLDEDDLYDERKAISGLQLLDEVEQSRTGIPTHRYAYPEQEAALRRGKEVSAVDTVHKVRLGEIQAIDPIHRTIDIKKTGKTADVHPVAIYSADVVRPQPLDTSLLALARTVVSNQTPADDIDGDGPHRAARDLLLQRPPRLCRDGSGVDASSALRRGGESSLDAAKRLLQSLDGGVLPIQGPPGSGKTYLGARLIVDLMRRGLRVGVTAVSHKVIHNLLCETLKAASEEGFDLEVTHKANKTSEDLPEGFNEVKDNGKALAALGEQVVGGVAWLWARDDAVDSLDVLVVDEAGQMSLAHVLAAARSTHNLVLLGDPQQLEQPQRGSHPDGAEVAALEHLLAGHQTIPSDRGLFLDITWRLSPPICQLTSELYYEGRLRPEPRLERQRVDAADPFSENGLYFVPVEHRSNRSTAPEEVEAVVHLVERILQPQATWTDLEGTERPLTPDDILVVAPFNAQVTALSSRLPDLRIGTVDRFQGQQAPIVIYSLASSSVEDAPRGMTFLLDPHRLNVATSRARCQVILVASPRILEAECRTPEMMRWVNGLCRFRELAEEVGGCRS